MIMEDQKIEGKVDSHVALKILLALLPAVIFTQNYAWMTLNNKLGITFLVILGLMIWNVWQLTERNSIFERFFRLTEISFFLLPLSAIVFTFVLGSKAVSSTTNGAEQAGATIGTAVGGAFVVVIAFIIGVIGGVIMHLIASKYEKKAELLNLKQEDSLSNKHGIILSLVGVFVLAVLFGSATSNKKNDVKDDISMKNGNQTTVKDVASGTPTDVNADNKQAELSGKVDLEITKKGFSDANYDDSITMDLKFTNKTDKDMKGVQGTVTFYDMFDNEISTTKVAFDKGISAGQSKVWSTGTHYNQFMEEDKKLKDTELKDLKYKWVVTTIVYGDGTKESAE